MSDIDDLSATGWAALRSAQWLRAVACFERALAVAPTGDAHDGLGIALWWLNRVVEAHQQRMLAYNLFRRRGMKRRASRIAIWLAREQVFLHSNSHSMRGWFARAERLLETEGDCVEHAWYALMRASMMAAPDELERTARTVIEAAELYGDTDLEAAGLAFAGRACVSRNQFHEGMAQLDEAMAAALGGEVADLMVVSEIFCVMLAACELAGDLDRSENWCRAAAEFARRHGCPFLSAYCKTTYGSLLIATGRWLDAEAALTEAIHIFEAGHRGLRVHAVLKLADLRAWQGRLDEAEVLLSGFEDYDQSVLPLSRIYLARGDTRLAYALLEEKLQRIPQGELQRAPLLLLLIEVLLSLNEAELAHDALEQLSGIGREGANPMLLAQVALATAQLRRHAGEGDAVEWLDAALRHLQGYEQSHVAARVRLEMARNLKEKDSAAAVTWARAAYASFDRIGATRAVEEAAQVLRQLGASVGARRVQREPLTKREEDVLAFLAEGMSNREIATRLVISPKTVEHHVSQILSKLALRSRSEAAAFAVSRKSASDTLR